MRVDAGLAKLLGMSRTSVATMIDSGDVLVDGAQAVRSAKLVEDSWLEITLPEPDRPPVVVAETVEGLTILYRDADIVVVDKPVGVAAHPSPGWTGPTVLGALAGLGIRTSTSGAEERQGIVHRLDVGTTGVMVVALSERAYSVLKDAFRDRTVEKIYHAVVQGHPDPSAGTIDAPDRPAPVVGLEVRGRRGRPGEHHPLRDPGGIPVGQPASGAPGNRSHASDPGALLGHPAPRASATGPTAPTRRWPPGSG